MARRETGKITLIRHSEDERPRDSTYRYDPKLTEQGRLYTFKMYKKLLKRSIPDVIYTSPMYRSLQTALILKKLLQEDGYEVKILIVPALNRFFSDSERRANPKTRDSKVDVTEDWSAFQRRVKRFARKQTYSKNIWMVTHYLVIRCFSKVHKFSTPEKMPALWNIIVEPVFRET